MEMPKPGPRHAALQIFAGEWRGTERMPPSQWLKEESVADGRCVNRAALGGFAVTQDYVQTSGGEVRFEGHGVFTWDEGPSEYCLHWFDSMGGPLETFRGQAEGNTWTFLSKGPMGHMLSVWEFDAPGRYRHRMTVSPDGENWSVMMEGDYRKVGD